MPSKTTTRHARYRGGRQSRRSLRSLLGQLSVGLAPVGDEVAHFATMDRWLGLAHIAPDFTT